MKTVIQKIFNLLKSLFLRLRVIVTLQLGKDKVDVEEDNTGSIPSARGCTKTEKGTNSNEK